MENNLFESSINIAVPYDMNLWKTKMGGEKNSNEYDFLENNFPPYVV